MVKINIPGGFKQALTDPVNLAVFVFDSKGTLLEAAPVNTKGSAEFKNIDKYGRTIRVLIVPEPDKSIYRIKSIEELQRFRPYEPVLQTIKEGYTFLPIPELHLKYWQLRFCRVTGVVSKNFLIDHKYVRLPLCKARVHICEVDKIAWLIPRLPDDIILRIPDIFIDPPIRLPKPWPPILTDPHLFEKLPVINPVRRAPDLKLNFAIQPTLSVLTQIKPKNHLPKLDPAILKTFQSKNVAAIKNVLIQQADLLIPYFCIAPWIWPYLYKADEIKTVYTDENGRYAADIIYLATGDKPDIYVWVEYLIDGMWTTVYCPAVPCNTYWDYACGTDINVNVTDQRVIPLCDQNFDLDAVWVRAIGGTSIRQVAQSSAGVPIQGVALDRQGLIHNGTDYLSPVGTTAGSARMRFVAKFGHLLPYTSATYFRWACRKVKDGNLLPDTSSTIYFDDVINRPYIYSYHEDPMDPTSSIHFSESSVNLGPKTKGTHSNLFLIPPKSPVGFEGVSHANAEWSNANTICTQIDTNALPGDGLYLFWMEIFDKNGVRVNKPNPFFQIPKPSDPANSEDAHGGYVGLNDGMNAFQMLVRIDNNATDAAIYPVKMTQPNKTADDCGFLKFTNINTKNISIGFKAFHPFNFATFNFSVVRGNLGTGGAGTPASVSGHVIGHVGRYLRNASGDYYPRTLPVDDEFSPAELMGPCALSGRAAFAESLSVHALHTDGYRRLFEYDDSALAAFALES